MGTGAGSARALAVAFAVSLLACSGAVAVARAQDTERIEGMPAGWTSPGLVRSPTPFPLLAPRSDYALPRSPSCLSTRAGGCKWICRRRHDWNWKCGTL
jgi:hypothetical protein